MRDEGLIKGDITLLSTAQATAHCNPQDITPEVRERVFEHFKHGAQLVEPRPSLTWRHKLTFAMDRIIAIARGF